MIKRMFSSFLLCLVIQCYKRDILIRKTRETSMLNCSLTPLSEEGPFFMGNMPERSDIRAKRDGVPLFLDLSLRDAETCQPVRDARIYIWHCDAIGIYSGFRVKIPGEVLEGRHHIQNSLSFFRGYQTTSANGLVQFTTIVPGWYIGRAVHIHYEVIYQQKVVSIGQLFFPKNVPRLVQTAHPYKLNKRAWTENEDDRVFRFSDGDKTLLTTKGDLRGLSASFEIVVNLNLSIPVGLGPGHHPGYNPGDYPVPPTPCPCNSHKLTTLKKYIGGPEM